MKISHYIIGFIAIYITFSAIEWWIHGGLMHNDDQNSFWFKMEKKTGIELSEPHLQHHRETEPDMSLITEQVMPNGELRGIYFGDYEKASIFLVPQIAFIALFWAGKSIGLYNTSFREITPFLIWMAALSMWIIYFWRYIHKYIHNVGPKPPYDSSGFSKWFIKNHVIHHFQLGSLKGNYNITLPGWDFIIGTYRTTVNNTEWCGSELSRMYSICDNPIIDDPMEFLKSQYVPERKKYKRPDIVHDCIRVKRDGKQVLLDKDGKEIHVETVVSE